MSQKEKFKDKKKKSLSLLISKLILELIKSNSNIKYDPKDPFSQRKIPEIPIDYYIERIKKSCATRFSTGYTPRLSCPSRSMTWPWTHQVKSPCWLSSWFISCCVLAIKFNEDCFYNNEYYAKIGGIDLYEMNHLESFCIEMLNFNLFVKEVIFKKYINYLENYSKK